MCSVQNMCYKTTNIFVLMPFRKSCPYYKQSSLAIVTICNYCISNEFKKIAALGNLFD